jgi:hypothetical protein
MLIIKLKPNTHIECFFCYICIMDNSFIRLKPTFNQAKQMLDPKQSQFRYYDCIALHPDETYLQVTDSAVDVVFGNSYKASIIDCAEKELKNITDNFAIFEGVDAKGVQQIAFEIVNIGESWYGVPVFLKLESTIGPDVFYSNAFTVTDQETDETVRFVYKYFGGNFSYYQSIRLKALFNILQDETENSTYIQVDGNVLSKKPTIVFSESYNIQEINNFTYRSLAVNIKSDIVYLDSFRVTDKPQIKNGESQGRSNLTSAEFTLHRNLDDFYIDANQITTPFLFTGKYPNSYINLLSANNNKIVATFNKNVVLGTNGIMQIYQVGGFLQYTLTINDFDVVGNTIQSKLPITNYVADYADYYVNFTVDLLKSTTNEDIELNSITDWTFKIGRGDFKDSDFKNIDFLIYT